MRRYNLAGRYKLTRVLHDAYLAAHLCSYLAGVFVFDLVLLLQMALDLIWPHCVLALLAYGHLVLCHIIEILTRYACFSYPNTLDLYSLLLTSVKLVVYT
jgi:hypothetical protein